MVREPSTPSLAFANAADSFLPTTRCDLGIRRDRRVGVDGNVGASLARFECRAIRSRRGRRRILDAAPGRPSGRRRPIDARSRRRTFRWPARVRCSARRRVHDRSCRARSRQSVRCGARPVSRASPDLSLRRDRTSSRPVVPPQHPARSRRQQPAGARAHARSSSRVTLWRLQEISNGATF